jgi:hypothetical protein
MFPVDLAQHEGTKGSGWGSQVALTERRLQKYPCPVCKALINGVVINEEDILESKRCPAIVPAKCPSKHDVALYVDREFRIRDAEPLIDPKTEGGLDKARKWVTGL